MDGALFATLLLYTVSLACVAGLAVYGMVRQTRKRRRLEQRLSGVTDADAETARLSADIDDLAADYAEKRAHHQALAEELIAFDEDLAFAQVGLYAPHFEFPDSDRYRSEIEKLRQQQKAMVAANTAVTSVLPPPPEEDRQKAVAALDRAVKLTLRAYNAECDAAVANVRWANIGAMEKRIIRGRELIDELNEPLKLFIAKEYAQLKLKELYLTHEMREKLRHERAEEAEHARIANEELKLDHDVAAAASDEQRYGQLLAKARLEASTVGGGRLKAFDGHIKSIEANLGEARARLARAQSMVERTRAGFVYIVSNVGSFGEDIVKIGLTRRLDIDDKVRELGVEAVPFPFDLHALIYSDDAAAMAKSFRTLFENRRVNTAETRRDFYRVDLDDIEAAVRRLAPDAGFTRRQEAQEFRETEMREDGDGQAAPEAASL
ncbi:MAG: DUF4041 domain-containing protein [Devosia sp.]